MVQRAQYCFEHDRAVSNPQKNFRARDAVECSNVFLNNPGVLKNSIEHAEPLFIAFRQFPQMTLISLRISWRQCTRPGEIGLQPVALTLGFT